jgi:hypothetical protein
LAGRNGESLLGGRLDSVCLTEPTTHRRECYCLDSQPIQGVVESYRARCWKALEYRRWVEEGLIGEMADPFEAVKWPQALAGE